VPQALLTRAEQQSARSDFPAAIESYSLVLKAAPDEYTPCMKALLGRRDAYFAVGKMDLGGQDSRQEFAWGRGHRWPGWYIIAVIMFRNEIVRT
jgi:hypothetical protein